MKTNYIHMDGRNTRALIGDRKTQTRRVVKPQPSSVDENGLWFRMQSGGEVLLHQPCPYGQRGDLLWVRETFGCPCHNSMQPVDGCELIYRATDEHDGDYPLSGWRPSIHMPRWASRLTLYLTDVRVERLEEISEADAWAEGVTYDAAMEFADEGSPDPALVFLNGPWASQFDPDTWVWALTFRVIHANVDDVLAHPDRYLTEAA